ncbi:MAG: glycosyltransferase family 9 protein [Selenomonas sp.]|uniref:glycosyltransferase family 9 protein n=1 Tax=Selenomonas sp. TaxID=2053611 RepID=UPI0025CF0E53|nr:glycosyltransferase family 9 protein [Selenomonas sp.]MCR5440097.1 glycosyltransferase family 9 protein [Selenomonas sp.]
MQKKNIEPADGTRILIVRLSAIGDVLHATAVVHNLKRIYPNCHLTWLVSPPADSLLQNNPDIDELLIWDRRIIDRAFAQKKFGTVLRCLKDAKALLDAHEFDIALDIQGLFLSGILTRLSGAPRRIGIHERHEGNFLFMSEMAPDIDDPHKIRRYMTALSPLGITPADFQPGLILTLTDSQRTWAKEFWQAHDIEIGNPNRPLLLVNTRTTWPDKNWPAQNFGLALRQLPPAVQIVFTGAPGDIPYIQEAQTVLGRPSLSIAGKTNLRELSALFAEADLLLTGDTGPLYIAEAVGLTTLSLWGPTHPNIYGPLTAGHHFILSPHSCTACCKTKCRHKTNACMNAIEPSVVTEELMNLLK